MWQSKRSAEISNLPKSVRAAQLVLLAQGLGKDMLIVVTATVLVGLYLIPSQALWAPLSVWLASFSLLALAGLPVARFIRKTAMRETRLDVAELTLTGYAGLTCTLWSSLIFLYWHVHETEQLIIISAIIALANVSTATTFMLYRPAMLVALFCINLPVLAKLIVAGTANELVLALVLIGTAAIFFRAGWNSNQDVANALALRQANKELVAKLNLSLAEANYANAAKSRFLATVSHQLRTPLNAIIGFSELMQQKVHGALGDNRYDDYVTDIVDSSDRLLGMINDILDLTKLESGELEPIDEPFRLPDILEQAIKQNTQLARQHGITLVATTPDLQIDLIGDRKHVIQILSALLSNAIKFSKPEQTVTISTDWRDNGDLAIAVIDKGIGMTAEMADRVLNPFEQTDRSGSQLGAMGLGLPLAKALAERQGASIEIRSEQGSGTTAYLVWPSEKIIAGRPQPQARQTQQN
ncbi:MAG TPA: hypothetical protein DDW95_10560 [Alphaproteobacteria bacterium]|nr:hypothetical protein [Alphaproteobacteria bacterium]